MINILARTFLAYLLGNVFWYCVGSLFYSHEFGLYTALLSGVVVPTIGPALYWIYLRSSGTIKPFNYAGKSQLRLAYFQSILSESGPSPRVWIASKQGLYAFWFKNLWKQGIYREELIISNELLADPNFREEWSRIWHEMAIQSGTERSLRSLQMAIWCGLIFPLLPMLYLLRALRSLLQFKELAVELFSIQSVLIGLQTTLFGSNAVSRIHGLNASRLLDYQPQTTTPSFVERSLLWGVWLSFPANSLHPIYALVLDSEA